MGSSTVTTRRFDQAARAVIALGGLQDCTVQFAGAPVDDLRKAAVDGAMSALGFS